MTQDTKFHTKYKLIKHGEDDKVVPSVTTVINDSLGWNKNVLMNWAARMAQQGEDHVKVREAAANIGTAAHDMIECLLLGVKFDPDKYSKNTLDPAKVAFKAFKNWWEHEGLHMCWIEFPFATTLGYGGTVDLIAGDDNDNLYLIDFKTSDGIYPEHIIQVAAYYRALTTPGMQEQHDTDNLEHTPMAVGGVNILRLGKTDGSFDIKGIGIEQLEWGMCVFDNCLKLYELKNEGKLKGYI